MTRKLYSLLILTIHFILANTKMMRNDALISKMVSNFHKDKSDKQVVTQPPRPPPPPPRLHPQPQPSNVVSVMQKVLCNNFPTIPCDLIVKDATLSQLIQRSIQQIKHKKTYIAKTTAYPGYHLSRFPTINSEDLSSFLQVNDRGYFSIPISQKSDVRKHKKHVKLDKNDVDKKQPKRSKKVKKTFDVKKMARKFYPHKMKFKDKFEGGKRRDEFVANSDDKVSMSVEIPDLNGGKNTGYQTDVGDSPVWKVDYTRQGTPNFMFDYQRERLQKKLIKHSPLEVEDKVVEQKPRKDVLQPDLYIKKNYFRQNDVDMNVNSAIMD